MFFELLFKKKTLSAVLTLSVISPHYLCALIYKNRSYMADSKQLIPIILKWEGGWSNHPSDKGGATMRGITYSTFCAWRQQQHRPQPSVADLRQLGQEEWNSIFLSFYWHKWKADLIENQGIANLLVDFAWASGAATSIRHIQKNVLCLKPDGIVGPLTLRAINNHPNPKELFVRIKEARIAFVNRLAERDATQKVFLKGWTNRINSFTFGN